jgi:hypothetical protein
MGCAIYHWVKSQAKGVVIDQAALVGLIRRLHGLGIVLISIRQIKTIENL